MFSTSSSALGIAGLRLPWMKLSCWSRVIVRGLIDEFSRDHQPRASRASRSGLVDAPSPPGSMADALRLPPRALLPVPLRIHRDLLRPGRRLFPSRDRFHSPAAARSTPHSGRASLALGASRDGI